MPPSGGFFFIAPAPALGYESPMQTQVKKTKNSVPLSTRLEALISDLENHKALDIVDLDISAQGGNFADHLLIVTATSQRHARSLADAVADLCHANGYEYLRVEGFREGQWVLVDLNDIVVNIFQSDTRELYRLEDLWSGLAGGK